MPVQLLLVVLLAAAASSARRGEGRQLPVARASVAPLTGTALSHARAAAAVLAPIPRLGVRRVGPAERVGSATLAHEQLPDGSWTGPWGPQAFLARAADERSATGAPQGPAPEITHWPVDVHVFRLRTATGLREFKVYFPQESPGQAKTLARLRRWLGQLPKQWAGLMPSATILPFDFVRFGEIAGQRRVVDQGAHAAANELRELALFPKVLAKSSRGLMYETPGSDAYPRAQARIRGRFPPPSPDLPSAAARFGVHPVHVDQLIDVLNHEFFHALTEAGGERSGTFPEVPRNSEQMTPEGWTAAMARDRRSVSGYGDTLHWEDFAEAGRLFLATDGGRTHPEVLQAYAHRFAFIRKFFLPGPAAADRRPRA